MHQNKANSLLLASHKYAIKKDLPWASTMRETFATNGLQDIYQAIIRNNQTTQEERRHPAATVLIKRLIDQFHQTSLESINNSSKMKVLRLLKQTPGTEVYLDIVKKHKTQKSDVKTPIIKSYPRNLRGAGIRKIIMLVKDSVHIARPWDAQ